ncbi:MULTISPECIES: urease accessory protein UreF [Streptomyces]|uniref:urease accessory protein UreF n=1 Tax=Streptomyces TaxID=1883 RepID=UPI000241B349|nr:MULTISPECIES: urease accessory UreF family protein [Streptomyces]EHM25328.1 urease accessory protein UreF-like protein [Streptomyces sp. W007]MCX4487161.1 urease accessory protein UreF [Streptomyces anulatus]WSI81743.1 urease accessory protein UreF [Streptomyces anulatus]WTD23885.1 urease accessory protein UreF [Streptomyces anulatus]
MSTSPLLLALLGDARLPSGGHTQSAGLEPALRAGIAPAEVPAYLRSRLRTVTMVEAGTAVVARAVAANAGDLAEVEAAWAARTPSPALRANGRRLGRGYLRVLQRLWPGPVDARARTWSRPVILGLLAHRAGMNPADVARLVGYDDAQTVTAALLKLEPQDPLTIAAWVSELLPDIEKMADKAALLRLPEQIPAHGAPLIERWAETHDTITERLFSA